MTLIQTPQYLRAKTFPVLASLWRRNYAAPRAVSCSRRPTSEACGGRMHTADAAGGAKIAPGRPP